MTVNAYIIGAQKCGTTSLREYLGQHPLVRQRNADFPGEQDGAREICLYKGPIWIYEPHHAAQIAARDPEARIIAVLRNQADRAFAHWRHNMRKGREFRDFEDAIASEPRRISRNKYFRRSFSYLDRGRYAEQLDRFANHFPAKHIVVVKFEDLVKDPPALCEHLFRFLGLKPCPIDTTTRFNENLYELRSRLLAVPFYGLNFIMSENSRLLHSQRIRLHSRLNLRRAGEKPRIDPKVRQQIMAHFERENEKLTELWGVDVR